MVEDTSAAADCKSEQLGAMHLLTAVMHSVLTNGPKIERPCHQRRLSVCQWTLESLPSFLSIPMANTTPTTLNKDPVKYAKMHDDQSRCMSA